MAEKPKLLIIDDEPDQRNYIKSFFAKRNFLVFTAKSGEEAILLLKENKPDLVLLDMKLEGTIQGIDVLRALRQYDMETKVAIVTGDILKEEQVKEITKLGIVKFLHKPVNIETLETIIKNILEDNYPKAVSFEEIIPKREPDPIPLRSIIHDLSNITSDIANKCELYILDTEQGLNKDKSEKECLDETIKILKSVLKSTERLTDLVKKLSSFVDE